MENNIKMDVFRFSCTHCEALLEVPANSFNSENALIAIINLRCPKCSTINRVRKTYLAQKSSILELSIRKYRKLYQIFFGNNLKDETMPAEMTSAINELTAYLKHRISKFLQDRYISTFTFLGFVSLIFLFSAFYTAGQNILELKEYPGSNWVLNIILILLILIIDSLLRKSPGEENIKLHTRKQNILFVNFLHTAIILSIFLFLQDLFQYFSTVSYYAIFTEKELNANFYTISAYLTWLVTIYTVFFLTKKTIYIYALITGMFLTIFSEVLLFAALPATYNFSIFQFAGNTLTLSLVYIVFHLFTFSFFALLVLKSLKPFINKKETYVLQFSYFLIYLSYFILPFYYLNITKSWQVMIFAILFFLCALLFTCFSVYFKSKYLFNLGQFYCLIAILELSYLKHYILDYYLLSIFIIFWLIYFIPNYFINKSYKAKYLSGDYVGDIILQEGYLKSKDFYIQGLGGIAITIWANYLFFDLAIYPLYIVAVLVISTMQIFINFYHVSYISRFFPWLAIVLTLSTGVYKYNISGHTTVWFALFLLFMVIAYIWKYIIEINYVSKFSK